MNPKTISDELSKKGFVVLPNFLDNSDVSAEMLDWLESAKKFKDGVISDLPELYIESIKKKISKLIPEIADQLGISVHTDRFAYSAIRIQKSEGGPELRLPFDLHRDPKIHPGGVLNWHVDHFSYYLLGDHKNYLICYMPVKKPDHKSSNLAIIPYDILHKFDPDSHFRIKERGALRFRCVEHDTKLWFQMRFPEESIEIGDWFAIDDYFPQAGWKMKIDLESQKVTPFLAENDLLIMRADVIHRTQDSKSDRISIRCDALPRSSKELNSWEGLLNIYFNLLFDSEKVRYNKKIWLKNELNKKLTQIRHIK